MSLLPFVLPLTLIFMAQESLAHLCLKLFCEDENCDNCTGITSSQLNRWRRYMDVIIQNFKGNDDPDRINFYRQLREKPICVKPAPGELCSLNLINEPKVQPHQFYELGCRKHGSFWNPIKCGQGNSRCCNTTLCNLPTDEEISKLVSNVPKDSTLIVILPIILVILLLVFIGSCFYWRCRNKPDWDKVRHMPGNVIGNSAPGDHSHHPGGATSPSAASPDAAAAWLEGSSAISTSVVAPSQINGSLGGAGDVGFMNPTRQPLLPPNTSISSGMVLGKPAVTVNTPSTIYRHGAAIHSSGVNSIGSGVFGGSLGAYAPTAASVLMSGDTGMLPASCSAPLGAALDLAVISSGSGSGSGQPLLVERTVARQVHLEERIGEGRYGDVWRGRLNCDQVAVKIFSSRSETSWSREKEFYETPTLRHTNILGFIAADNKDNGLSTELWLIVEYHPLGSLYEFLQCHSFTLPALVKMASSIANGLAHLHMPIVGTSGKPRIAHRDLKSRNILVKSDGECCIGDLGFAVKLDPSTHSVDMVTPPNTSERVGTKRYMAPEVLDNTLRADSFDAYMQADMYSLGLVFWEMTRRVYVPDLYGPEEYQLPYQGSVGADPLVEEMKSVVCEQGLRPHLPLVWQQNATLRDLFNIMTECWYATPSDRLSAMRIKKDLSIQRQMLGPPLLIAPDQLPYHLPPQSLLVGEVEGSVASLPPGMFYYRSPPHNNQGENITYAPTDITDSSPVTAHSATHLVAGNVQPPNIVANFANC